ncbi:Na+/H+ antiporter subunit E [Paradevosia shaoguanensis]|uniref:Na+/H+ antiporter subunit E n=1 Tax=Paradevosia shaoguanensis TaxID=1335043 RepID=A0AA41QK49_9HYPH|nr:Na+/H+ antiporter subunit E [Paradevosia shaoguanensis]KFL28278.1 monovalent cation/H+ antiporter subunit E [Devosia sp. 17-2-E-8]MCF1741893.1 Na+/H+ antiporter subunit E [Paradevosia shaoguanensis]MCI0126376.1 Na+/H+ antiporter subunit E [Paradevosia shaoguanensis]CDP49977.1 Na(+) H(+) antiporter subunit E [Devosia sp. DBB001]
MKRILPYPLLSLSLLVMWLLLNQSLGLGQILLGAFIAVMAGLVTAALDPPKPKVRSYFAILKLLWVVVIDVLRSNIEVVGVILSGRSRETNRFIEIPLELRDRVGLTILACIITATPGSAWLNYDSFRGVVLIHVLDLQDEAVWIATVKQRYEALLLEIFQ